MIAPLLIFAASVASAAAVTVAPGSILQEAAHAIDAGRLEQARLMVGRAIADGANGAEVERVLADLAFAKGNYSEALARYDKLLGAAPTQPALLERAGISALKLGDIARAAPLIAQATSGGRGSWRAWNARGVVADMRHDWTDADEAYAQALRLAPDEADIINNRGWSQLLRGDWAGAVQDLQRAAAGDPKATRIVNNLELARAALAADLPRRRAGEADEAWAKRLNDAGVAAEILGDKARAIAAFTQALQASGSWYARAANNLSAITAASE